MLNLNFHYSAASVLDTRRAKLTLFETFFAWRIPLV